MYFQHSLILMNTILWQAYAWIQCWINLFTWILTFLIILPKLYYFLSQLFYLESCYRNHLSAQLTPSFTGLLLLLLLKKKHLMIQLLHTLISMKLIIWLSCFIATQIPECCSSIYVYFLTELNLSIWDAEFHQG